MTERLSHHEKTSDEPNLAYQEIRRAWEAITDSRWIKDTRWVIYVLWKLIPYLISGLPMCSPVLYVAFSLIDGFFCCAEALDFDVATSTFAFVACAFGVIPMKSLPRSMLWSASLHFLEIPVIQWIWKTHKMWGGDHLELASPGWEKKETDSQDNLQAPLELFALENFCERKSLHQWRTPSA